MNERMNWWMNEWKNETMNNWNTQKSPLLSWIRTPKCNGHGLSDSKTQWPQKLVYSHEFQGGMHIKWSFHTVERESITGKPYKPYN